MEAVKNRNMLQALIGLALIFLVWSAGLVIIGMAASWTWTCLRVGFFMVLPGTAS